MRDGDAFRQLVELYRHELQVHCYRILGSVQDAEDVLQETLLAAWRGLDGFEGRSSLRSWLYRIATNRCLNALRDNGRRPQGAKVTPVVPLPTPTRVDDPSWLEPYPDILLDNLADTALGPDARYETREAVSLAFLAALQHLPARQRAVLVLRDVLGFRAAETAEMLDSSEGSVNGALKRARATLAIRLPTADRDTAPLPGTARERKIMDDFARAFEAGDVDAIITMLTDDVWLTMPPLPMAYQGHDAARHFLGTISFREGLTYLLVPTHANRQPAFGCYLRDPRTPIAHAHGLIVLTLAGDQVSAFTRFRDNGLMSRFGLPHSLR
jgi:RNA polymerase sigma-70 factor, ECF subfamily